MSEQSVHKQGWQTFADPKFALTFQYPETTPQGDKIEIDEIRVHFQSIASQAFYLEISRSLHTSPQAAYERECEFLANRFDGLSISALTENTINDQPVFEFSFQWPGGERSVILIVKQSVLYRLLYDPRQPLTRQALATLNIL